MASSTLPVTVMVVDAEDTGEVSFVQREPQVDKTITAKVSDPDGGVTNTKWQWAKADETVLAPTCVPRPVLGVTLDGH